MNVKLKLNEIFPGHEDLRNPRFTLLRERYDLDSVVEGETDEFKRILLLRNWIENHIMINDPNPTPTRSDAIAILDAALKGGGFHCAHFSLVQHAILNAYGYVARRLGAGPGHKPPGKSGYHGVNEVWLNGLAKWMLIDAKYDLHFEKDGVPLSALEVRDEVWKNDGKDVKKVVGVDRKELTEDFPERLHTYRWIYFEVSTNFFSTYPNQQSSAGVVLDDDLFKNNEWYRDGKPCWAYKGDYFRKVENRDWIEWTPNVISSDVKVDGQTANIRLRSYTPNFLTYQAKNDDGKWYDCDDIFEMEIPEDGITMTFHAVNLAGVVGPNHTVELKRG